MGARGENMETVSMVILLIIAFLAWSEGITWLFVGSLILFIILARSITVMFVAIIGIAALYLLRLGQYWFIMLIIVILIALLVQSRKRAKAPEFYSPELMRLLGGS